MADRAILHSDLNAFYASVETMLNPSLEGKAVAVCGCAEDRHGIVLAKSELAKRHGVKTAMPTWEAHRLCPGLIIVPPQYDQYLKYSVLTREIYQRYTDLVEPYGMDECFMDITAGTQDFEGAVQLAQTIRTTVRRELGLTVSVGVSFNKVFAKLGSDMKKPDAVTAISREDYRRLIWPLPVGELFFVGRATAKKLGQMGICTIGDLAATPADALGQAFGKNGPLLLAYAGGRDASPVMHRDFSAPAKSISHGITLTSDAHNPGEVWRVLLALSQDIGQKLRGSHMAARGVQIGVKDNQLGVRQYQGPLACPTHLSLELARTGQRLFEANYPWHLPVRCLTLRAINLLPGEVPQQLGLFDDGVALQKQEKLAQAVDSIRDRFGYRALCPATLMGDLKMANDQSHEVILPGVMYQ